MFKKARVIQMKGEYDPEYYKERVRRNEVFLGNDRAQMAFSQEKISNSVVGVAGQGGLGGGVAMLLARLGVRHLKICDPDSFETSNINRQLGAAPLVAACAHFLIIKSFELADASTLAPFTYSEVIAATILGFLVFGDAPDLWTYIGLSIIIASAIGLLIVKQPDKAPSHA
jgi:drug/metabolite transporter (DMT)-like permease